MNLPWLLTDEEFTHISFINNEDWWNVLYDNDILCEWASLSSFCYSRFDCDFDEPFSARECPHCQSKEQHYYLESEKRWTCKKCQNSFSVTTKTYLDNTKLPLYKWDRACRMIEKWGNIPSQRLAIDLDVTQPTAFGMIKTIQSALRSEAHKSAITCLMQIPAFKIKRRTPVTDTEKERECLDKLFAAIYGRHMSCPKCNASNVKFIRITTRKSYQCPKCYHQIYPCQGTIFEKTTTPLEKWFMAIHLLDIDKDMSVKKLQGKIFVSYKTAWRIKNQIQPTKALSSDILNKLSIIGADLLRKGI